jgi:hypothetical protein
MKASSFLSINFFSMACTTRAPGVARREVRCNRARPLSQQEMFESQRRLYDLGLFKQVDTAIQNPDGTESRKNVLGHGDAKPTATPSITAAVSSSRPDNPQYGTSSAAWSYRSQPHGVSRREPHQRRRPPADPQFEDAISVACSRERSPATTSPSCSTWSNLRFTATGLYDNTVDVSTFTSKRLEGTLQLRKVLYTKSAGPRTDDLRLPLSATAAWRPAMLR